jgi:hypothetical protein
MYLIPTRLLRELTMRSRFKVGLVALVALIFLEIALRIASSSGAFVVAACRDRAEALLNEFPNESGGGTGEAEADYLFLCPEVMEELSDAERRTWSSRLAAVDLALISSEDLGVAGLLPKRDTTSINLCAESVLDGFLFGVDEVWLGYGSQIGYSTSYREVRIFLFGTWVRVVEYDRSTSLGTG